MPKGDMQAGRFLPLSGWPRLSGPRVDRRRQDVYYPGMRITILPDRLRYARELRGLTLRQLGDLVGVSVRTLQRYEQGDGTPNEAVLDKLAIHLQMSPEYLQGKVEGMTSKRVEGDLVHRASSEASPTPDLQEGMAKVAESASRFGAELGDAMQKATAGAAATMAELGTLSIVSPRFLDFMAAMKGPQPDKRLSPMELAEQILAQTPEEIEAVLLIVRVQMARMGLPWPGAK